MYLSLHTSYSSSIAHVLEVVVAAVYTSKNSRLRNVNEHDGTMSQVGRVLGWLVSWSVFTHVEGEVRCFKGICLLLPSTVQRKRSKGGKGEKRSFPENTGGG